MKNVNFTFNSVVQTSARWLITLIAILTLGVGQMWGLDIYLDISACTGWTNDGATIKLYPGTGSDVTGSSVATNLYKFTVTSATSTMYFKRMSGSSTWNQGSVTYNSSYNLYKLTGWDAAACSNANVSTITKTNYIYFDNSTTNWSNSYKYFIIGHNYPSNYSKVYSMSALSHTKLWYVAQSSDSWVDATYYGMCSPTSSWSNGDWGSSNLSNANKYAAAYTGKYDMNNGSSYLITPASSSNNCALSIDYKSGYSQLNYSQTVQKYTCTAANDGSMASHYTAASINSGTVTITPYKLTGNGTVSNSSNTGTLDEASETSVSKDAVYTGEVTLTASANTGYEFVGWFSSTTASTALSTAAEYTYDAPNSTKTIYARFKENRFTAYVQTYTNGTASPTSSTNKMGQITGGAITATPNTGYRFNGWTLNSGSGSFADASAASTTFYPTSNSQLKANFVAKTYTVTLDGNGGSDGTATATYNATSLSGITHCARASYDLDGYFTATSGGTKVVNADGTLTASAGDYTTSLSKWKYDGNATLHAQWTYNPVTYTVSFGRRSGQSSDLGTVTARNTSASEDISSGASVVGGSTVEVTASPTSHYKLEAWYNAASGGSVIAGAGTTNPYSFTLSANTKVYASFVIKTCTITLNKNGGSSNSSVTATHGSTLPSFSAITRSGYTLKGYYTETSGGTKIINANGALVASTAYANASSQWNNDATELTLYAQWEEKLTTVTINASPSGTGTFTVNGAAFTPGNTTTAGKTTSRTVVATAANDYAFSSWSVTGNATGSNSTNTYTLKGNGSGGTGTLTANFTLVDCKLKKLDAAKNGTETDKGSMSYDATEHAYYKEITTDASPYYFRFTHNSSTKYCSDWKDSNYDSGKEITANGSKIDCDKSVGGWTDKPAMYYNGESGTTIRIWFDYQNKKVWITADKDKQYVLRGAFADNDSQKDGMPGWDATTSYFTGLSSGNTGTVSCTLNAAEWYHAKVYDMYTKTWYGRSTDAALSDGTLATATSGGGDFYFQTTIAGSYTFTFDKSSGTKVKVDYPASYQLNYSIGSVAGTSGSINTSPSTASGSYVASGNTVTLTAPAAKTGYTWKGWYTNTAGTEGKIADTNRAITVTMNADKTLYACYTEDMHTVTVTTDGHGSITTPASGSPRTVSAGIATGATIAVSASTGYTFYNWTKTSGSGTVTFTNANANSTTVKSTSDATVRANFVDTWNLKGSQWDSWGTYKPLTATANANEYSISLSLTKGTKYDFKVIKRAYYGSDAGTTDTWYGNTNGAGDKVFTRGMSAFTTIADGTSNNLSVTPDVSGTYTFTINTSGSTPKLTVTFQPAYTVTFGKGTGGETISASGSTDGAITSGNYVKAGDDITFTQTANPGYTFSNWYTTKDAGGSVVSTMGASDNILNSIAANATVYSRYTPNNYTVTFDATTNGGSCGTTSKDVTYDAAYGTLPVATHAANTFIGWYTTASGEGTRVTAETIVSTAGDHTLYARFESTYEVTVQYKCGDVTLSPQTKTNASATSLAADISAPEILGYEFNNWTGSNASFGNASSATTTVNATAATTITANYRAVPTVYFKNNLSWEKVYVTFDNTWVSSAPCNNGKPYFEMTQLGTSDIFYCRIPDTYTASSYAGWAWNIAFDNKGFSSSANVGNKSEGFDSGEFLGRGDFDPEATMFIPYNGDKESRNGGTYYMTGCWMKYNSTDPGYKVYVNNAKTGAGSSVGEALLTADVAGGFEFRAKVNLTTANYTYGFMLHKEYQQNTNDIWYSNTGEIWSNTNTLPWHFYTNDITATGQRCGLKTETAGEYEFIVSFGTGRPVVDVIYPVGVGDWRLVYKDLATWSHGAHTAAWAHPSRVIKAKANAEDIVSFYVSKATGASATVELQKCTAINPSTGAQTWTKQGSNLDLSAITATGIYNFKVTQNGSKIATAAFDGSYTGNFYIRTDASDGGWSNYKTSGANTMTYSEYSIDNGGDFGSYSHYFMRYVTAGTNIKFCIANDYSECISDTVVSDDYTSEWIEANGNVRFMWYHGTNKIGRAYISGSSNVSDRFLVLEGDAKMFNEDGSALAISGLNANEKNFTDDQNWIYETTVKAQPGARIKLTARYNGEIQYFYGAEGARTDETTDLLIGGSGTDKYKIRIVYDFKTNRLIKAFIPEGAISTDLSIDADLMIIREAQGDAQQITFSGSGKLSDVKTVYGAMKFNKWTVNNKSMDEGHSNLGWSESKRGIFFISFPFDVKLSDAFGFGTYGTHWIIEYYDGKGRAKNGFWVDSEPNWKFVMPSERSSFTMKAFEGYILALDLDEMKEESSVWSNGVEDVYVYFPSDGVVSNIQATNRLIPIDQTDYECTINRSTPHGNRTVYDSYWHVIGVPSFANYSRDLSETSGGATINWTSTSMPYLYEWNAQTNAMTVTSSATFTFKPMYSYLVQYSGASIYWSQVNATPASVVARQRDENPTNVEFRLELRQDEQVADQTFVRMTSDEAVTTGFDFSYDLSKEKNAKKPNIYTMVSTLKNGELSVTESAGNCLPLSEQTTVVPVGLTIPAAGDYTLSMPDGTNGVGVTLIDQETGIHTNLSALDYTVNLEAGECDGRFLLQISPISYVPTEVEQSDISDQRSDVRKVLIDGLLYIVRDNKVYDARGARVE